MVWPFFNNLHFFHLTTNISCSVTLGAKGHICHYFGRYDHLHPKAILHYIYFLIIIIFISDPSQNVNNRPQRSSENYSRRRWTYRVLTNGDTVTTQRLVKTRCGGQAKQQSMCVAWHVCGMTCVWHDMWVAWLPHEQKSKHKSHTPRKHSCLQRRLFSKDICFTRVLIHKYLGYLFIGT